MKSQYGVVIYIVTVIGIFAVCTLARVVKLATKDCFDSDLNVVYPLKLNLS